MEPIEGYEWAKVLAALVIHVSVVEAGKVIIIRREGLRSQDKFLKLVTQMHDPDNIHSPDGVATSSGTGGPSPGTDATTIAIDLNNVI